MLGHYFRRAAAGVGQAAFRTVSFIRFASRSSLLWLSKISIATLIHGKIVLVLKKYDEANQLLDHDGSHARRRSKVTLAKEN